MITRMLDHVRQNTVAYLALVFSVIGGGGGYAVAATTHRGSAKKSATTAIVACASKKSGELFLHPKGGKCAKGRHKVSWNARGPKGARGKTGAAGAPGATGPAGAPAPSIFAAVDPTGSLLVADPAQGVQIQKVSTGVYTATITDSVCARGENVPIVTASQGYATGEPTPPTNAAPVAFLKDNVVSTPVYTISTGYMADGAFTAEDLRFDFLDTCTPPGISSQAR